MAKAKNLVIVESPAKSKTIGKYLGPDYKVMASMGHLRDLPKNVISVDIENGFVPNYQPVKGREDTINELKAAAEKSEKVFLATDPDREGEAISWHLKELLELPDDSTYRVTFNEITKKVVTESIANPRDINQNLVDAQQARRILDRIVGYKLSPFLWRKIRKGLSAGRVQSVATRMVADREAEIREFIPEEYWNYNVLLNRENGKGSFSAKIIKKDGKKLELKSEDEVLAVTDAISDAEFIISTVKKDTKKRSPAPPFITSSLQQEASRRLGMTPRRTMSIAQQLYEGIDIEGMGTVGLITYMRTDSLRISEEALSAAGNLIKSRYGDSFYPGKPRYFKTKGNAQDAHEAIRPSDVFITPDSVRGKISNDQYRLYRLIWSRFIASQMSDALFDSMTIDVDAKNYTFRANCSVMKFPGHTAVYEENKEDEQEESAKPLPDLHEGEKVLLSKIDTEQRFTQPPSRYTEATLIREMEETGVGRPSTYAPTVSTILDREYVVKEGKYLRTTPLGEVVTQLMKDRFTDIVDLGFTAKMEGELDNVEKGEKYWKDVLSDFYTPFNSSLESAEKAMDHERIKVPDEVSEEKCDLCGRNLVVKTSRFGRFLACPGFPECKFTKPIVIEMPGKCPKCGGRILKLTSRNGYTYYSCERRADCGFMTWDVPTKDICPECGHTMFKKSGRGYNKPFCINEECENFLPEDKRGYRKKTAKTENGEEAAVAAVEEDGKKAKTAKKTATKKTAAKKKAAAGNTETPKKPGRPKKKKEE